MRHHFGLVGGVLFVLVKCAVLATPLGWFDTLSPQSLYQRQTIAGTGWSADAALGAPVTRVEIKIDGTTVCNADLGGYRPDVADAYQRQDFLQSGWAFTYDIGDLSAGGHTVSAVAFDAGENSSEMGNTYSISVSAGHPPIGGFDGFRDSHLNRGNTLIATGWAADPERGAPVTSVSIFIDGNYVGEGTMGA